ncbi:hypothetical protein [Paenibacillus turpanensis]|uniref:hypothetical protein n=1 Tax=Paenibacillus turpanensis TaxID=2689078 RepID=UPI00140BB0F9|nr:hypothetical protein [Paenibacillus turpanensis]
MNKNVLSLLLLIAGGLPLILYPFVMIANIMSLAGERSGNESMLLLLVVYAFIFLSSTYVITYLISVILYIKKKSSRLKMAAIPLIHLALVVCSFLLWMGME